MRRTTPALAAIAVLAFTATAILSACGDDDAAASELVKSDAPRVAPDPAAARGAAAALDAFSLDLYGVLAREQGNLVFSPYSAAVALAMTRAGAAGETLDQMSAVLHTSQATDFDAGLNTIDQELATRAGEYRWIDKTVKLELATANQLWAQQDYPFHDAFLDRLAASYGAGVRLVDYIKATEASRKAINTWVSEQTRERIPELIPEGVITADTRLVLTNAIYLKAPWRHRFDKDATAPGPFTRLDGSTVQASMMHLGESLRYAEGKDYQAIELPYVDGSLAMLVIVPDPGRFETVQSSLDPASLEAIVGDLQAARVQLTFPKFEFRTQASLKDPLIELGMPIAFEGGRADFSAMSSEGRDLYIQDVIHEAFIAVDEDGTEAAAATAVIVGETAAPIKTVTLKVDRPFIFAIRDNDTGAILFLGRVLDPTS